MAEPFLFLRRPDLEQSWPYVPQALISRLRAAGGVTVLNEASAVAPNRLTDVSGFIGIVNFSGRVPVETLEAARNLKVIGGVFDNAATGTEWSVEELDRRGIAVIDATRGWAQSVAECALALALGALRSVPQWHTRMAAREPLWVYPAAQFCDNPDFVNGDLGEKKVGVLGLGQIGRRIARWCVALGSEVCGYDPYLPEEQVREWGLRKVDLDALVDFAEVVFVAIPPTPTAKKILNRERIYRLRRGALVTLITRAHPVDMDALRERILAGELFGAFDVYDREPLPVDDPLRGRANVVHTPHIAGRTRDANLRVAQILAEDFIRVQRGEKPLNRLSPRAVEVRTSSSPSLA
ncbi:MAG: NAD(P)-binding domain-containing protein [Planctomycetes bacterium]|nr:NAD(P)-binding domain-containing protein [Planctomycetota bacterium]